MRCYLVQHNFKSSELGMMLIECFDRCSTEVNDQVPVIGGRQVAQISYPFGDCENGLNEQNWVFAVVLGDEACQMYLAKILRDCADFHEVTADGFAEHMIQIVNEKAAKLLEQEAEELTKELYADIEAGLLTSNPEL